MGRFTGKSVVITGGSSGIELAAARRVVDEGGRVLITGSNSARLDAIQAENPAIAVLENDASRPEAAEALATEVRRLLGTVDAAFLNAGWARASRSGILRPRCTGRSWTST